MNQLILRLSVNRPNRGVLVLLLSALSCLNALSSAPVPLAANDSSLADLRAAVIAHHAVLVSATFEDSLAAARKLQNAVEALLAKPSEAALAGARKAWLAARVPYCQSEVTRFYDGPIDQLEGNVNTWPIDENYIDYVAENPDSGIINDVAHFPTLSRELILSLNEKEGKKNVSTGFHAIEFLLWGQDLSPTGPGERPWRDYAAEAKNGTRRRQYLRLVTNLLVEHLEKVAAAWAPGKSDNYRAEFLALPTDVALANILKGMGALSGPELAGERMTVPYETKEQEEEQSCFSDNTRDDLVNDAVGIQNIYLGRYETLGGRKLKGPGLHDLLLRADPEFAAKLAAQIDSSVAFISQIPQPFDQAIQGTDQDLGRIALKRAIVSVQTQSDLIAKAAKSLALNLNLGAR